jgi:hypothetical protein
MGKLPTLTPFRASFQGSPETVIGNFSQREKEGKSLVEACYLDVVRVPLSESTLTACWRNS